MIKQTTLGKLICEARGITPSKGNYKGICGACGENGRELLKSNYRKTFSLSEYLHESDYICPYCSELYENQEYRYSNWVCSNTEFRKLKKAEVLSSLLLQENIPFAIYTTNSYQKQGWIRMIVKGINYTTSFFTIGYDVILFHISRKDLLFYIEQIKMLRKAKISTNELLSGNISLRTLSNIPEFERRRLIKFLRQNKDNPKWLWIIEYSKSKGALNHL